MGKDNFILYSEQEQLFNLLNDTQAGKLIKAIFEYEKNGTIPKLNPQTNMAFISIKTTLDRNKEKYEKVIERNKQNGKKGGRPKTQNNPENPVGFLETQNNPEKPKKADNDNEHDNDNEYDIDVVLKELIKYYEDNIGILVPATTTDLIDLRDTFSKDLIKQAIDIACRKNIRNMSYVKGILRDWERKGYRTLVDIQDEGINKNNTEDRVKEALYGR